MSTTLWFAALSLAMAVPAGAQESFDKLPQKVRPGQTVIVVDQRGAEIKGKVEEVTDARLVVDYGRGVIDPSLPTSRAFTPADVSRVLKPGHLWDGAIKGAVIGMIPILVLAASDDCYDCGWGPAVATTGLIGAGIGIGIDALWGPKTVYRSNVRASRVSLAPILGRERKGVAAAIRF
jgi:hypothetical protein